MPGLRVDCFPFAVSLFASDTIHRMLFAIKDGSRIKFTAIMMTFISHAVTDRRHGVLRTSSRIGPGGGLVGWQIHRLGYLRMVCAIHRMAD